MAPRRELIEPHQGDKRFVRRDATDKFGEQTDVGRSLAADRRQKATTTVMSGQGDKGDRSATRDLHSSCGTAWDG